MQKKILIFLLLLVLIIPAIWPLFQPGFFVTDDGNWMIIRLSAFHETLRSGQFPVRFLERLNHGLGYPVLDFLYPLPFYLGELIHLLGFNFIDSVKILFALSFIARLLFFNFFLEPNPIRLAYDSSHYHMVAERIATKSYGLGKLLLN